MQRRRGVHKSVQERHFRSVPVALRGDGRRPALQHRQMRPAYGHLQGTAVRGVTTRTCSDVSCVDNLAPITWHGGHHEAFVGDLDDTTGQVFLLRVYCLCWRFVISSWISFLQKVELVRQVRSLSTQDRAC